MAAESSSPKTSLLDHTAGVWIAKSIALATELGIADFISDSQVPIVELASRTGSHEQSLYRLMRALASVGVFKELPGKRFEHTPLSFLLRTGQGDSLAGIAKLYASDPYFRVWSHLGHTVRTGEPAFYDLFGVSRWSRYADHESEAELFDEAMLAWSHVFHKEAIRAIDLSPFKTIIDVGGGYGELLAELLRENDHLDGILLELPRIVERAKPKLRSLLDSGRIKIIAGDFLQEVPRGGDLYILANVLVDWDDTNAESILRNCHRVVSETNAKLVILEPVISDSKESDFARLLDVHIMLMGHGRVRTKDAIERLLKASGFCMDCFVSSPFSSRVEASAK